MGKEVARVVPRAKDRERQVKYKEKGEAAPQKKHKRCLTSYRQRG